MPSLSAIIVRAGLSGCVVAALFVLADVSARTQLQQAVASSRSSQPNMKPAARLVLTTAGSLDKQRLTTTIAMISHASAE